MKTIGHKAAKTRGVRAAKTRHIKREVKRREVKRSEEGGEQKRIEGKGEGRTSTARAFVGRASRLAMLWCSRWLWKDNNKKRSVSK